MSRGKTRKKIRISPLRIEILRLLKEGNQRTWSAIASQLDRKRPSVSRSAKDLVEAGLVKVSGNSIEITEKGIQYLESAKNRVQYMVAKMIKKIETWEDSI